MKPAHAEAPHMHKSQRRGTMMLMSLLLIGTLVILSAPSKASEAPPFRVVGELPLEFPAGQQEFYKSQSGWMVLNSHTRRSYVFTLPESATGGSQGGVIIQSYDLDTLRPLKRRVMGASERLFLLTRPLYNTVGTSMVYALDERGGRIFLPVSDSSGGGGFLVENFSLADSQRSFKALVTLNEAKFHSDAADEDVFDDRRTLTTEEQTVLSTHGMLGLQYFEQGGHGALLSLWADWKPGLGEFTAKNHQLVQWSTDGPAGSWIRPELLTTPCGRAQIIGSSEPSRIMYPAAILRGSDYIAIACQKREGVAQVVVIGLNPDGTPDAEATSTYPLARKYSDVIADQAGQRLLLRTQFNGSSWWVFDVTRRKWVGAIGTAAFDNGRTNSAGIDPASGRFYSLIPNHFYNGAQGPVPVTGGFGYVDSRLDPVPQLEVPVPELAYPGRFPILIDPEAPGRPRRIFLRRGTSNDTCYQQDTVEAEPCNAEGHYLVIEDRQPVSSASSEADPDRYTTDVPEEDGVTAVNFDRSASGFGARVLSISGVTGATTRAADGSQAIAHGSPCPVEDREALFGEVAYARVSNSVASSQANGLRIDNNTASEIDDAIGQCWPTPRVGVLTNGVDSVSSPEHSFLPHPRVNITSTSCTGDKNSAKADAAVAPAPIGTQSVKTNCAHKIGTFDSESGAGGITLGDVHVASSSSHAWIEKRSDGVPATRVESSAHGIVITGVGRIGEIRATADAWAGGRENTAHTKFVREICDVDVGSVKKSGCLDEKEQKELVAELNRRFSGNGEVLLRQPDAAYAKGSPGGYQAAIQRDRYEQFVDRIIGRDFSRAVPGLEFVFYRDDGAEGAAREVLQFAAVEASSQYGIYCLFGQTTADRCDRAFGAGPAATGPGPLALVEPMLRTDSELPTVDVDPVPAVSKKPTGIKGFLERLARLPADLMRLILSGPSELLLTAGVWMLVWLPCLLGDRRRSARRALLQRMGGVGA